MLQIMFGQSKYYSDALSDNVKRGNRSKIEKGWRPNQAPLGYAPRTVHSAKPGEMRTMIERVSYTPRLEVFARSKADGWDVWGNEVQSDILIAA